jgi:transcriptional regulator with XRE-family HTH domain
MSKRSNEKRITRGARVLRFLREQANLSIRDAAKKAGMSMSLVAHLEQGRAAILSRHLEKLLSSYGSSALTYQMFESGRVSLPQDLRLECLEIVRAMSLDQLRTAHPVLVSLSSHK